MSVYGAIIDTVCMRNTDRIGVFNLCTDDENGSITAVKRGQSVKST